MNSSRRVLKNTIVMYTKLILSTIIWLYITRVVIDVLGVEDYGIYTLIAGVIGVLAFVNSALMSSTQRFLSYSIGSRDDEKICQYFSSGIIIHIFVALIVGVLLETFTLFLFNGFLNIPSDRIVIAEQMYQLMVISTLVTIVGVPYNALINAYEDMWYIGLIQIITTLLKLLVVIGFDVFFCDKLLLFTIWLSSITIVEVVCSYLWCVIKYPFCRYVSLSVQRHKTSITEMISFTGWNTLGAFAVVGRNQGVTTVLNVFWGPKINGVFGIANQVDSQLISFSNMLTAAMTPQIIKSEGEGNRSKLVFLSVFASKLTFFLSAIFAVPLLIELSFVLQVWLVTVPEHTELYCKLVLCMFLICELYPGLLRGIQAIGKIKWQQILTSTVVLSPIPLGILFFSYGASHYVILYMMVFAQIISASISVFYSHKYFDLDVKSFMIFVFLAILSFILSYYMGIVIKESLEGAINDYLRFFLVSLLSAILFSIIYYFLCFSKSERQLIIRMVNDIKARLL